MFLLCNEENEKDRADTVVLFAHFFFSLKKAHRVKINKPMILHLIGSSQYYGYPNP
ncbi:hypothetical protein B4158_6086 [Bacillus cereus]|nr:hypothetical protein B4158_6086 [Bacillus cereus]